MSSEQFTHCRVRFFTECLFDSLFGEFALLDNEGKFIEQYIEADISQVLTVSTITMDYMSTSVAPKFAPTTYG
jgi:hypothetical protein